MRRLDSARRLPPCLVGNSLMGVRVRVRASLGLGLGLGLVG